MEFSMLKENSKDENFKGMWSFFLILLESANSKKLKWFWVDYSSTDSNQSHMKEFMNYLNLNV